MILPVQLFSCTLINSSRRRKICMEDYDLQSILKQLAQLEKRVHDLETIINGSSKRKPGRKSMLSSE